MRPLDEVLTDVAHARSINDAVTLERLAIELDEHGTLVAEATASRSRGTVSYMRGAYAESMSHFTHALSLYEALGDGIGIARVNNSIGTLLLHTEKIEQALEYFNRAYDLSREHHDVKGIPSIENHLGQVYRRLGDLPAALEHFHRSLSLCEQVGDLNGAAGALSNIGGTFSDAGDYPSALDHLQRALVQMVQLGNRRFEATTILNIGNVYDSIGSHDEALMHYRNSLDIFQEIGDRSGIASNTTCIGWTYQNMGDLSTALDYHYRALALHQEIGELEAAANDLCNVILVLLEQNNVEDARLCFADFDTMRIIDPVLNIWREQCRAWIQRLDGDTTGAAATLHHALNIALEHDLRSKAADVHKDLRDVAQQRNDLAAYIEHNTTYTNITEELRGKNTVVKLATQEAERRIASERQEHEKYLSILHSTLPKHIADRVARGVVVNDHYENASVIFLDIVGFTTISDRVPSGHVVHLLEQIFTTLDAVCEKHDVVKIKTIGDSYMAVSFDSVTNAATCALDMISSLDALEITMPPSLGDTSWTKDVGDIKVRIGMHCGPVTAGVIGTARMQYDVWGDTVNVASRMESSGEPGRIHVSEAFAHSLTPCLPDSLTLLQRGEISIKGKGMMHTYWLEDTQ